MNRKLVEKLREEIQQIEIIDSHEHLMNQEMLGNLSFDLSQAFGAEYIRDDLISLGFMTNLMLEKRELGPLLDELLPILKHTQNTSYYRAFFKALQDLHGLEGDELDPANLKAVSGSIVEAYKRRDWYSSVIREKCKIKYMIRDMNYMVADDDFIRPAIRMDSYLMLRHKEFLKSWYEDDPTFSFRISRSEYQERVKTLDDYLGLIEADFETALDFGAIAIKIGIAYNRTLQFDNVSVDEANRVFKRSDEKTTWDDIKVFQDYVTFRIIEKATEHRLPVQIHTGLLANGINRLDNANPLHLNNLFLEFPETRFDIFHGSFPFMGEIGSLALMFPNVYLDTCWLPLISFESFKRAFSEWLCYVPVGKFLWGGDCFCAEGVYGAVAMVRQGLAEVLAEKIDREMFDEEMALYVARSILHDNAIDLFGL